MLWIACFGCDRDLRDREAILAWLVCDECAAGERDSVRNIGGSAVPMLAQLMDTLPPELDDSLALQIARRWSPALFPDSARYVSFFVENARARARTRAAQSLGDLRAATELQIALDTALSRSYRVDVIRAIRGALAIARTGAAQVAFLQVAPDSMQVPRGATARLSLFLLDADSNVVGGQVLWSSSENSIATVDTAGNVTGVATGQVVIRAAIPGGPADSARVTVLAAPPPRYRLEIASGNNQSAPPGEQLAAPVRVRLLDASGTPVPHISITWSVLRGTGRVAYEGGGRGRPGFGRTTLTTPTDTAGEATVRWVLGPEPGSQRLEARSTRAPAVTLRARATPAVAQPITVELTPDSVTLETGDAAQLTATVLGGTAASPRTVTFTSSDPAIATVNQVTGRVVAIAPGRASITARATADPAAGDITVVIVRNQDIVPPPDSSLQAISPPSPGAVEAD